MTALRTASRFLVVAFVAGAVLAAGALPAGAHASLVSTDPQDQGVYDAPPPAITLRFNEPVEITLGGVRVFDGDGDRVDAGAPRHPGGRGTEVRAGLPDLDDGTYVVTWRVTSADAHPIEGAFTFQVGPEATAGNARGLAARLLSEQGGSTTVGVLYAIARGLVYVSLALLIGGALFVLAIHPLGRRIRRTRVIVWTGWAVLTVVTIVGIGLEGAYVGALDVADVFDTSVWSDVLDTRYGEVAVARLVLLAVALPLLVLLFRRPRGDGARRLPAVQARSRVPWWYPGIAAVVAIGLAATPGLAGHAATGDHVALAVVADTLHVLAMACWIGGLVMLVAVVLVRPLPSFGEGSSSAPAALLRSAVNRFSALALGCVAVLVVTGGFQAWRQVGSLEALRDTDFGRLLLVKLVVFAAMVVAAAFSREVVNRRFRDAPEPDVPTEVEPVPALVGGPTPPAPPVPPAWDVDGGRGANDDDRDDDIDDEEVDRQEARRLRRSVLAEVGFAAVVLAVTALLVNTAPARTESTEPVALAMRSGGVFADVTISPAIVGRNDIHVTVLPTGADSVTDLQMQLTRPGEDVAPFDVPLRPLGPGHEYAPQYNIPFSGDWRVVLRVQLGTSDEAVLTDDFSIR